MTKSGSMIPRRVLGDTGLSVSSIGLGGAVLGNLYRAIPDDVAAQTLTAALDAGIRYIDTAPHYGRGLSERRIGDALRDREGIVLSTKVGRLMLPDMSIVQENGGTLDGFHSPMPFRGVYDYSRDGVLRSWEQSLQRLGIARIDLLYIHDIGRRQHGEDHDRTWRQLTRGGGLAALEELRAAGEITGFGAGLNEIAVCLDLLAETRLDVVLLAGRYTLLEQEALTALFPACARTGTPVVIGGPYNSGILAQGTQTDATMRYDYAPASQPVVARVARIEAIAADHGVPLAAAALRLPLAHPQVASVIPGLGSPQEVAATRALLAVPIPDGFWQELIAADLLHPDCPLPKAA